MDTYFLRNEVLDSVLNGTIEAVGNAVDILASAHPAEGIGHPLASCLYLLQHHWR